MVNLKRRLYDPERQRVFWEIEVEIPTGETITLKETGLISTVARRLAARFALPIDPKELTATLLEQSNNVETSVIQENETNDDLYYTFHCFLTEKGEKLLSEQKLWLVPGQNNYSVRITEEAFKEFLAYASIPNSERRSLLKYWQVKGWLRTNNPEHFKKRIKVKHSDAPSNWFECYEIVLSEEFHVDETLPEFFGVSIPVPVAGAKPKNN